MADVGTVLIIARELFPDSPATLSSPSGFTSAQFAATPTLAAGSYIVQVTLFTQWGESLASTLSNVTVDGAHGIQVSGSLPVGATKLRVYYGISSVNQFQDFTSLPAQISTPGTAGVPPATAGGTPKGRAYLPDSDGAFVSAATLYRWLNQALDEATNLSGGIEDSSGVGSSVGVGMYTLPIVGWKKITNVWYDGYDVFSGRKRDIFRRNTITAYTAMSVSVTTTPNTVIEAFPQPQRTAGTTTLNGSLSSVATSVAINSATGFVLPIGMAAISQGTATEIVYYSSLSNNTMSGMTRGLGGSIPQVFTPGAVVTELNFWIEGYRRAVYHSVGDATKTIQVPPAWVSLLPIFMEAKFREVEKDYRQADSLKKEFREAIKAEAMSNKQLSGPVQIGGERNLDVRGRGPFGWILP